MKADNISINNFDKTYKKFQSIDFERVVRREYGAASLQILNQYLKELKGQLFRISIYKTAIDGALLSQIESFLFKLSQLSARVLKISSEQEFLDARSDIEAEFVALFNEHYLPYWPSILAIITDQELEKKNERLIDVGKVLAQANEQLGSIEALKAQVETNLKELNDRYSSPVQKAELINQSNVFKDEADRYRKLASDWQKGIITVSIIFLVVIIIIFKFFCFESSCFTIGNRLSNTLFCSECNLPILYLEIFKAVIFRLFIVSLLAYFLTYCIKNYNACMHNFTVNNHKANSLESSRWLIERLHSPEATDQIILQAANAIFAHQPTGYNNKDPENTNVSTVEKIVDKAADKI